MIGFDEVDSVRVLRPEPGDIVYIRLRRDIPTEERETVAKNIDHFFEGRNLKVLFDVRGDVEEITVIRPPKETTNG